MHAPLDVFPRSGVAKRKSMAQDLSKEEKLDVANQAREEVKQLLSVAKEGSVNGVRK